jgi:hypothetical protein
MNSLTEMDIHLGMEGTLREDLPSTVSAQISMVNEKRLLAKI